MKPRVAVIGLGAMGSASAYHLARRGASVVGIDQFDPPHTVGSTHGRSRIIREAYYEHPVYVPLVQRAYELWDELERTTGRRLFHQTGGVMVGPESGVLVSGAMRSVREHGLAHEMLGPSEAMKRFPALRLEEEWVALLEPRAGLLLPELCVSSQLELAESHGAELRRTTLMESIDAGSESSDVVVRTSSGEIAAGYVVLATGSWMANGELANLLQVERQMLHWFRPASMPDQCHADQCPLGLWEYAPDRIFATFPDLGDGVKCGIHHEGETTTPDAVRRETSADEDALVRGLLERVMPPAAGELVEKRVCLYTNTADHNFLIDWHPSMPKVLVVSACSGHGFKFASAIGEVVADLVLDGKSRFDLSLFAMDAARTT